MGLLQIGRTGIPYEVRRSSRCRRRRIEVTPTGVAVIVPADASEDGADSAAAFITARRTWVFNAVSDCAAAAGRNEAQRYAAGAKLPYRGRLLMIEIQPTTGDAASVVCRSRLVVSLPQRTWADPIERERTARSEIRQWMDEDLRTAGQRLADRATTRLGIRAVRVRIGGGDRAWAVCTPTGIVRLHRDLAAAPPAAMRYVLAHEVAHRVERNHSAAFWRHVGQIEPDWEQLRHIFDCWIKERPHRTM